MSNDRLKIQHYHTTGITVPSPNDMELGEIAVGTNPNKACLYFKDNNNNLHTVTPSGSGGDIDDSNYLKLQSNSLQRVTGQVDFANIITASTIAGNFDNGDSLILQNGDEMGDTIGVITINSDSVSIDANGGTDSSSLCIYENHIDFNINRDEGNTNITIGNEYDYEDDNLSSYIKINGTKVSLEGHTHNYAASTHSHNTSAITGGTLNIARIPTGTTSTTVSRGDHTHSYLPLSGGTLTGNLTAPAFYETSDERLKTFGDDIKVDFEKLSKLRKSYFKFNTEDKSHIGVSAQEIKEIYPEIVSENKDGYLSVDYAKLSVVALKAVDVLYKEVSEIKGMLKEIINNK